MRDLTLAQRAARVRLVRSLRTIVYELEDIMVSDDVGLLDQAHVARLGNGLGVLQRLLTDLLPAVST
jgi:hypothetical protein